MKFIAAILASCAYANISLPQSWKGEATQTIDCQNVSGCRKGVSTFNDYYDYPNRHRYEYTDVTNGKNQIYAFNTIDAATGCGTFYSWTVKKCCHKAMVEDDGTCTNMVPIQVSKRAQDQGDVTYGDNLTGDEWESHTNLFHVHQTEDWIVTPAGAVGAWYQNIQIGESGESYITVDVDYTNQVVGQLTDADFAVPEGCTNTCLGSEFEEALVGTPYQRYPQIEQVFAQ